MSQGVYTIADAERVSARIGRERGIHLVPGRFALDGREELDPDHEGKVIAEYGYSSLVNYYCPGWGRGDPS